MNTVSLFYYTATSSLTPTVPSPLSQVATVIIKYYVNHWGYAVSCGSQQSACHLQLVALAGVLFVAASYLAMQDAATGQSSQGARRAAGGAKLPVWLKSPDRTTALAAKSVHVRGRGKEQR
jgi:hypothetical protein